jgi:hypothetical protein
MRSHVRASASAILLAMLFGSSAKAQDRPSTRLVSDIGFAPGVGYFYYPQFVDRGYSINGQPYDLIWSGLQLQLSTDAHFYRSAYPRAPRFGIGVAAAFKIAPKAKAADWDNTVSVDPGRSALGGYLALSFAFRRGDIGRLAVETGVGREGISGALGFGGWGLAFGAGAHRMFGAGALATGVGLRLNLTAIVAPRIGNVRGESGLYASLLFEVLFAISQRAAPIPEEPPAPPAPPDATPSE